MSATVNTYKVIYHFEQKGVAASAPYIDYVQAAASDYNSLKTVLSNNSRIRGNGTTLVIDNVQEVGHGENCIA